jgi:cell wall-associated NlpC family hydrolase
MFSRVGHALPPNVVVCLVATAVTLLVTGFTLAVAPAGQASAAPAPQSAGGIEQVAASPPVGYVDVSVATVWTSPSSPRPLDKPALGNPVHIPRWLAAMNPAQKRWLITHNATQTQALYGQPVDIIGQRGRWDEVAVPGQPTPKNPLGYPGWVPKVQLVSAPVYGRLLASRPSVLVNTARTARLRRTAGTRGSLRVSFATRLPLLSRGPGGYRVATPSGGAGWIPAADATLYTSGIPAPTGADLVATAKMFRGVPYLWAGRSGYAFDCSGFTSALYQAYGITIPRDADAQALDGGATRVSRADLRPGDILFYASGGSIYHDALYIGGGRAIEAGLPGGSMPPITISAHIFGPGYWGAVRYLRS